MISDAEGNEDVYDEDDGSFEADDGKAESLDGEAIFEDVSHEDTDEVGGESAPTDEY